MEYDSAKREINGVYQTLQNWNCLDHLTMNERKRIMDDLIRIAICSMNDAKRNASHSSDKLIHEFNNEEFKI